MKIGFLLRKIFVVMGIVYFHTLSVCAQDSNLPVVLPTDSAVRYGKLGNGLTYYIRHNELPKGRAHFYMVQNTGSMQEEDNQRGLAYLLERMALAGTKHFPDNGIKNYIEKIGMKCDSDIDIHTDFDETVYMLKDAPVLKAGVVDSCLMILHDWSAAMSLTDEAIKKECAKIREELQTPLDARQRILQQQLPKMYPNCKYGQRLPTGEIGVLDNIKRDDAMAFYTKWYCPDLQALVIVGDVDVNKTEDKIKTLFSDISASAKSAKKEKIVVPDNNTPIASIAKDRENTDAELIVYYKHENVPNSIKGTIADFMINYTLSIISAIMDERFSEIMKTADKSLISITAKDADKYFISKTKSAWTTTAVIGNNNVENAMKILVAETEKVKQDGFTEAEYERAKTDILKLYEANYNNRGKRENGSYADEYANHFTDGGYISGIETEYMLVRNIVNTMPLEGINSYVKQLFKSNENGKNVAISLETPDKDGITYPTESELIRMFVKSTGGNVPDLITTALPAPGKIVDEKKDPLFGTTLYTLSNGIQVAVKHTDLNKEEILMRATSPGGTSLFKDDKDMYNIQVVNNAVAVGGLGTHKASDVRKALTGRNVDCRIGIGESTESVEGSASPSDIKTLFELIYLEFTGMRIDDDAYSSFLEGIKSYLDKQELEPMAAFSDTLATMLYDNHPRKRKIKSGDFDKVDYHRMIDMYKDRYADASDFVFTFVGNVNEDTLKPLMEQYLATLPTLKRTEKGDASQVVPFVKGIKKCHFTKELEPSKTTIGLIYTGKMKYNFENTVKTQLLKQVLDIVFYDKIRMDANATYVMTQMLMYDFPHGRTSLQIFFDATPSIQDIMLETIKNELHNIADNGPREADLEKGRNNILNLRKKDMQGNKYWLDVLDTYYYRHFDGHNGYEETLYKITADDIKTFASEFLKQGNCIEVMMSPSEKSDEKPAAAEEK